MAASFDDALVYRIFNAVSDETRAKYNEARRRGLENRRFLSLSVWTPNVNIFRDPRWGRGQETYGEDPYLTSRMGVSVVKGLQGPADAKYRKLLACGKHFAVHSGPEWSRHTINLNNVDPRDLYGKRTCLHSSRWSRKQTSARSCVPISAWTMSPAAATPACCRISSATTGASNTWSSPIAEQSPISTTATRSRPIATHAAAKGVLAGTDVECGLNYAFKTLPDAVAKGLITETGNQTNM